MLRSSHNIGVIFWAPDLWKPPNRANPPSIESGAASSATALCNLLWRLGVSKDLGFLLGVPLKRVEGWIC